MAGGYKIRRISLEDRQRRAEEQLAKARLKRRQMAERLAAAQEAFDAALRRELLAEESATSAAAKLAASPSPRRARRGDPLPQGERAGVPTAEARARRDALLGIALDPEFRAVKPVSSSRGHTESLRSVPSPRRGSGPTAGEGAAQADFLLPSADQLAEA